MILTSRADAGGLQDHATALCVTHSYYFKAGKYAKQKVAVNPSEANDTHQQS